MKKYLFLAIVLCLQTAGASETVIVSKENPTKESELVQEFKKNIFKLFADLKLTAQTAPQEDTVVTAIIVGNIDCSFEKLSSAKIESLGKNQKCEITDTAVASTNLVGEPAKRFLVALSGIRIVFPKLRQLMKKSCRNQLCKITGKLNLVSAKQVYPDGRTGFILELVN